jgi:hypothetical protein
VSAPRTAREVLIALALLAFGLIALPALVYVVGQQVVGEYADGLGGLYTAIGAALASGNPFAWILVLSPLLTVQLLRIWVRLRRPRPKVNRVTDSQAG